MSKRINISEHSEPLAAAITNDTNNLRFIP